MESDPDSNDLNSEFNALRLQCDGNDFLSRNAFFGGLPFATVINHKPIKKTRLFPPKNQNQIASNVRLKDST